MKDYFVWLAKLITFLLLLIIFIPLLIGAIISASQTETAELVGAERKSVAVVELTGIFHNSWVLGKRRSENTERH